MEHECAIEGCRESLGNADERDEWFKVAAEHYAEKHPGMPILVLHSKSRGE